MEAAYATTAATAAAILDVRALVSGGPAHHSLGSLGNRTRSSKKLAERGCYGCQLGPELSPMLFDNFTELLPSAFIT
jgi:hypothetical protein